MKKIVILAGMLGALSAWADPFYGGIDEEEEAENAVQAVDFEEKNAKNRCLPIQPANEINIRQNFEDLKLVGVVQFGEDKRALFNDQQGLVDLREGDLLGEQGIQIEKIGLKAVSYIHWLKTKNCANPHRILLKL